MDGKQGRPNDSYHAQVAAQHYDEVSAMEAAGELFGWPDEPWETLTARAARITTYFHQELVEAPVDPSLLADAEQQRTAFRELAGAARRLGLDPKPYNRATRQAEVLVDALSPDE